MKERELRRLRPEIGQEVLPLAKRLTGQTPILKRMDALPHETNGLLIRPEAPNQPWEIQYRRGHERLLEHVIAHEVGHIVRLYQVPESERLGLMVTEQTRERALDATAPELARLLEHGFPEQELPELFEEWLGALGSQLYAFPADLRIEAWMSKTYPGLRAIQQRSLLEEVGRNGPLFEPAVRALVPRKFYYPTMAMNAAQAWQVAMLYNRPVPSTPKEIKEVPHVWRDPSAAIGPIQRVIQNDFMDFRGDTSDKVRGAGAKALVQQRVGESSDLELKWVEREHGNAVSARWIFQTAVRRQCPLALQVTASDDPKFDALIEFGSPADTHIRKIADEVVRIYLENVVLKQNLHNPYTVGDIMVDPTSAEKFAHSLHSAYSGMNKTLELPFAKELDRQNVIWCRNPSRSGYPIPLLSFGESTNFYPDFLVWKGKHVFALDTKGEHILETEIGRKLLAVIPHPRAKISLLVRLISNGTWDKTPQRISGDGYTVWALGNANSLKPVHAATMADAVKAALRVVL